MVEDRLIGGVVGNYRVVRLLGRGGMGSVYLAEHPQISSRVAIKVLHPHHGADASLVQRFVGEARAANLIGHPGIVRIHDCGSDPDAGLYLVMEFLEGRTLAQRCEGSLPLQPRVGMRYIQQTASALAAAHQAGVVHRDLKPQNLFVTSDPDIQGGERIKVLDFGIAKLAGPGRPLADETATGVMVGSPKYMSPEQLIDSKQVDTRSDVYSLGIIAFELLTGRVPFDAGTVGRLILDQQNSRPPRPSAFNPLIPPDLDEVLLQALQLGPEQRFDSMSEFRAGLCEALLTDQEQEQAVFPLTQLKTESLQVPAFALPLPVEPNDDGDTATADPPLLPVTDDGATVVDQRTLSGEISPLADLAPAGAPAATLVDNGSDDRQEPVIILSPRMVSSNPKAPPDLPTDATWPPPTVPPGPPQRAQATRSAELPPGLDDPPTDHRSDDDDGASQGSALLRPSRLGPLLGLALAVAAVSALVAFGGLA